MATTTAIFLFLFLGLPYLIAEYLRAIGSDWPATCTPFEGEAQRWAKERQQADETAGREWGEVADLPPMNPETILRASDESFLDTLNNQPEPPTQRRVRPEKQSDVIEDPEVKDALVRTKKASQRIKEKEELRERTALNLEVTNKRN